MNAKCLTSSVIVLYGLWFPTHSCIAQESKLDSKIVDRMKTSVVRVTAIEEGGGPTTRIATGFVWPTSEYVVTALHVVVGAKLVSVEYMTKDDKFRVREAKVERVLIKSDLVLLRNYPKTG